MVMPRDANCHVTPLTPLLPLLPLLQCVELHVLAPHALVHFGVAERMVFTSSFRVCPALSLLVLQERAGGESRGF